MLLWAWLKRQNCRSPIDVADIATKVKSLFDLENSALGNGGVTKGERGHNSPGVKSLREPPKSPNNVTSTFFNTVHLRPKDLRFEHKGAKLVSCSGRHQTPLRLCLGMRI